ncbi:MAG: hypothetical protein N2692_00220 [Patescibacteria group bacterium]|jgi:hypothetical protein|nr:hypothetical protein [Patescibacteria group bacterium]
MKNLIKKQTKEIFLSLVLLLLTLLLLSSCTPLGLTVAVDTNLPINTTRVTVLNTTPYYFYILIDGVERGVAAPYGKWLARLWNTSLYGEEVSLQIVDRRGFAYADKVWARSNYYSYSYTFIIREDGGRFWVERR